MPRQPRQFAARWSPTTWLVTLLVIAIVIGVSCTFLCRSPEVTSTGSVERCRLTLPVLVLPGIFAVASLFAPVGYALTASAIVIRRLGPNIRIPYESIAEVRRLQKRQVGFGIRLGGSGGFFGFYGRFWSTRLGRHRMYATNAGDLVLVRLTDGRKIVVSPHPADAFVQDLSAAINAR